MSIVPEPFVLRSVPLEDCRFDFLALPGHDSRPLGGGFTCRRLPSYGSLTRKVICDTDIVQEEVE